MRATIRKARDFAAMLLLAGSASVSASSVTYILDQSNVFSEGADFLSVVISDDHEGQLDFLVSTLPVLSEIAGENYGIQSFGFNITSELFVRAHGPRAGESGVLTEQSILLPEGWESDLNRNMSQAGLMDVYVSGTGSSRMDPLEFSVIGLTLEDISGFFAAHVAGFNGPYVACGRPASEESVIENSEISCEERVGSGFFYGGRVVENPGEVPVPPALWLMLSGLAGLIGFARRGPNSRVRH